MHMKINTVLAVLLLGITSFQTSRHKDYVPDKATAIKIAEAVWLPIYGQRIYKELPFQVTLQGDTLWVVTGTSNPKSGYDSITKTVTVHFGGASYIEISRNDGKILAVDHPK